MYCHNCGAAQVANSTKCPACGQVLDTEFPAVPAAQSQPSAVVPQAGTVQPRKRTLGLIALICIPLLIVAGILIYNNSGAYQFKTYANSSHVIYHGSLEKLVEDDYGLLQRFLQTGKVDGTKVTQIQCNNYIIKNFQYSSGGAVDILSDNITFFESGLQAYNRNTAGDYYDRFRNDFKFEIETYDQLTDVFILGEIFGNHRPHEYYFCNSDDVLTWILHNT